jgi:hypothetical protein
MRLVGCAPLRTRRDMREARLRMAKGLLPVFALRDVLAYVNVSTMMVVP